MYNAALAPARGLRQHRTGIQADRLARVSPHCSRRNRFVSPGEYSNAMSQENVRSVHDTIGRRDAASVLPLYDLDIEWDRARARETVAQTVAHPPLERENPLEKRAFGVPLRGFEPRFPP